MATHAEVLAQAEGLLVLGDSELVINFCTRRNRPSRKFLEQVNRVRARAKALGVPVRFRHVKREANQIADWLTNVAR